MRIDANLQDNRNLVQRAGEDNAQKKVNDRKGASINATQLNLIPDSISERKKKAMADAMGIVHTQFKADGKIDQDLAERRKRISDSQQLAGAALKEINALAEEQEQLMKTYGIEPDSQQQQDIELRLKAQKAMDPRENVELTSEELERLQELEPLTEYQQQYMALESSKGKWREEIDAAYKVIADETRIIRGTKQELLKYHGMVDATRAAEETMKAASDAIVGMLVQEGMEQIQEEIEEAIQKGEVIQEEKEEKEQILEAQKEKRREQNEMLQELPDMQQVQSEAKQKLQEILEKQKLLEEDLKGIQVDDII